MFKSTIAWLFLLLICAVSVKASADSIQILVNQLAYNANAPKTAIINSPAAFPPVSIYHLVDPVTSKYVYTGTMKKSLQVRDWHPDRWFTGIDFSDFRAAGYFYIEIKTGGKKCRSYSFQIGPDALTKIAVPGITHFFFHQRAASPEEREADQHVRLFGSDKTVDLTGGWCDASGDVSKYFSHLAYTNFMSPQQIPMADWSMINTVERIPAILDETGSRDALTKEALYGADYIVRSLSPDGYFYMTVFSYFDKDPNARRVVGLLADSKTTSDYQCAWREGAGMAIASLARISKWKRDGDFTAEQYLAAAEKAFAHVQQFSTKYADDGKDNIIDDYCALMASSELWIVTGKIIYQEEARKRADHLAKRMSPAGYFIADDGRRPFWHAADAGVPVIALARYLDKESNPAYRAKALKTIKKALDYNLRLTKAVDNPFGYPRQSFVYKGKVKDGFFIPHDNESGWWWQGEDARLGSLAAAMMVGGRLVYPGKGPLGVQPAVADYASNLISWILGCNPYDMCMMFGYGKNNVPYMASMYGHGSGKGGISNGITGKDGKGDGSGIDFKVEDNGNEWRWSEQWIPHSSSFLQAVTALASPERLVSADNMGRRAASYSISNKTSAKTDGSKLFEGSRSAHSVLVLTERGGIHEGFVVAALDWLKKFSNEYKITFTIINNTDSISENYLSKFQSFIQLNYPPYMWTDSSKAAFEKYMEEGRGGWIGFHHASLLGEFDGYSMWNWYSDFMGGIRWKDYIAKKATATIRTEDLNHPVLKGIMQSFKIPDDEWYTYDKNPRPNVHVLANVDEESYQPASNIKMGDHPVIWSNEKMKAHNVYFQMGHDAKLFTSPEFRKMFSNAILWSLTTNNQQPAIPTREV